MIKRKLQTEIVEFLGRVDKVNKNLHKSPSTLHKEEIEEIILILEFKKALSEDKDTKRGIQSTLNYYYGKLSNFESELHFDA